MVLSIYCTAAYLRFHFLEFRVVQGRIHLVKPMKLIMRV